MISIMYFMDNCNFDVLCSFHIKQVLWIYHINHCYIVYCLGNHGHQKKKIKIPAILATVCSETAGLCKVWTGIEGHSVWLLLSYPYNMGTFFGNTHFCLCIWDTRQYKNSNTTGISPPSYIPSSCPKLRNSSKWLMRYGSIQTHTWTHRHTDTHIHIVPITRFTTGIGPKQGRSIQWWSLR